MPKMTLSPPEGFSAIWEATSSEKKSFSTIGVVIDLLPPTTVGQSDWVVTFELSDEANAGGPKLKCRVFAKTQEGLPRISAIGDVVVLRDLWMKMVKGQPILTATAAQADRGSWIVFAGTDLHSTGPVEELPFTKKSDKTKSPDSDIRQYALNVFQAVGLNLRAQVPVIHQQAGPPPNKFKLVQDLKLPPRDSAMGKGPTIWADILGEVTRMWPKDNMTEMYITDYTSNENLYNYSRKGANDSGRDGDEYGYTSERPPRNGPLGQKTLRVVLWDSHSEAGRKLPVGAYVKLENVRVRWDQIEGHIEGSMDKTTVSKRVGISRLSTAQKQNDPRYQEFMRRKQEYLQSLKDTDADGSEDEEDEEEKKSKLPAKARPPPGAGPNWERNRAQRERKKKKKGNGANDGNSETGGNGAEASQKSGPANVRIAHVPETTVPVTVAEVIDPSALIRQNPSNQQVPLPFRNNLYHLNNIRVIGYNPPDLAYFAAPCWNQADEDDSDSGSDSSGELDPAVDEAGNQRWEWRFELEVEDASVRQFSTTREKGRMKLLVAGEDANYLLRLTAGDLRKDNLTQQKLKQKLFLLWGNLEERRGGASGGAAGNSRTESHSGPPFECVVREYGAKPPGGEGYERVFAICMTQIVTLGSGTGGVGGEAT